mgnify:CR=1 FL=1|jgi:hypothetical protein
MAHPDHGVNIATRVEIGFQLHPERIAGRHEIVEDPIGNFLMGNAAVTPAVDVELERLEFQHPGTRLIEQAQHSEVGVAGKRALAGELWQFDRHFVGATGPGIVKTDQLAVSDQPLAVVRGGGGGWIGQSHDRRAREGACPGLAEGCRLPRGRGTQGQQARGNGMRGNATKTPIHNN